MSNYLTGEATYKNGKLHELAICCIDAPTKEMLELGLLHETYVDIPERVSNISNQEARRWLHSDTVKMYLWRWSQSMALRLSKCSKKVNILTSVDCRICRL